MNDPGRIAALELRNPQYVVVQSSNADQEQGVLDVVMEQFSMPATLKVRDVPQLVVLAINVKPQEHMIVCDSAQKPVVLFHLVHSIGITNALVFTKSAESTLRLVRLFEFFETARSTGKESEIQRKKPVVVEAYSSDLKPSDRKSILEKFKTKSIDMSG
jgi:ATP-dependent RNA helicase DDX51/DBP6